MNETGTATTANAQDTWTGTERRRVEKVVETLAALRNCGTSIAEVAHDARNMVTALTIYCDLLEVPGVLGVGFAHYAQELRLVAGASRRLVEKLLALDEGAPPNARVPSLFEASCGCAEVSAPQLRTGAAARSAITLRSLPLPAADAGNGGLLERSRAAATADAAGIENRVEEGIGGPIAERSGMRIEDRIRRADLLAAPPISNLAAELLANRNLLAALAGPSIALTMEADGGAQAVRLTAEDLTRLLVNLVKNAAEAMPRGGRIAIALHETECLKGTAPMLLLTVEDNGPGIPEDALDKIFTSGYTSRAKLTVDGSWPQMHRGLGLAIVRSIVEDAGGRITAANRAQGGACFALELPAQNSRKQDRY